MACRRVFNRQSGHTFRFFAEIIKGIKNTRKLIFFIFIFLTPDDRRLCRLIFRRIRAKKPGLVQPRALRE